MNPGVELDQRSRVVPAMPHFNLYQERVQLGSLALGQAYGSAASRVGLELRADVGDKVQIRSCDLGHERPTSGNNRDQILQGQATNRLPQ